MNKQHIRFLVLELNESALKVCVDDVKTSSIRMVIKMQKSPYCWDRYRSYQMKKS